jgi:hypothetical protein
MTEGNQQKAPVPRRNKFLLRQPKSALKLPPPSLRGADRDRHGRGMGCSEPANRACSVRGAVSVSEQRRRTSGAESASPKLRRIGGFWCRRAAQQNRVVWHPLLMLRLARCVNRAWTDLDPRDNGARQFVAGESRHKPRPRAGMPGAPAVPVCSCALSLRILHTDRAAAPGIPCSLILEGKEIWQSSGAWCREKARSCQRTLTHANSSCPAKNRASVT